MVISIISIKSPEEIIPMKWQFLFSSDGNLYYLLRRWFPCNGNLYYPHVMAISVIAIKSLEMIPIKSQPPVFQLNQLRRWFTWNGNFYFLLMAISTACISFLLMAISTACISWEDDSHVMAISIFSWEDDSHIMAISSIAIKFPEAISWKDDSHEMAISIF